MGNFSCSFSSNSSEQLSAAVKEATLPFSCTASPVCFPLRKSQASEEVAVISCFGDFCSPLFLCCPKIFTVERRASFLQPGLGVQLGMSSILGRPRLAISAPCFAEVASSKAVSISWIFWVVCQEAHQ